MPTLSVGALRESATGERRVALDPSAAAKLVKAGRAVLIESGAGVAAGFPDEEYTAAGASVESRQTVLVHSDVIAVVRTPDAALKTGIRDGQMLIRAA